MREWQSRLTEVLQPWSCKSQYNNCLVEFCVVYKKKVSSDVGMAMSWKKVIAKWLLLTRLDCWIVFLSMIHNRIASGGDAGGGGAGSVLESTVHEWAPRTRGWDMKNITDTCTHVDTHISQLLVVNRSFHAVIWLAFFLYPTVCYLFLLIHAAALFHYTMTYALQSCCKST